MSKKLSVHTGESGGYSPPSYYRETALASVDITSDESLVKWCSVLHLERKELIKAIQEFGPVVRDIRRGLLKSSQDNAA